MHVGEAPILSQPSKRLRFALARDRAHHVVRGTDHRFDMDDSDPQGPDRGGEEADAEERAAIAGGNAAKLLGIRWRMR